MNWELLNIQYTKKNVKRLLKNFYSIKALAEKGDTVASCIVLDLKTAIKQLNSNHRSLILEILLNGNSYRDYARTHKTNTTYICNQMDLAINKVVELLGGEDDE